MRTGFLVTLGDSTIDPGDQVSNDQTTDFTEARDLGTGIVRWANGGNSFQVSGQFFESDDGSVFFVPAVAPNAGSRGGTASVVEFNGIQPGVVCFTSGTMIHTPLGNVVIDNLRVGDWVSTLDNGPQRITWISKTTFGARDLHRFPKLRPVKIHAGVLGNDRDLLVSRQHGMVLGGAALVRAAHLARDMPGVRIAHGVRRVTYIHMMFENHQIILAENSPSESFFPGSIALRMLHPAAARDLSALFPDVAVNEEGPAAFAQHFGPHARSFVEPEQLPEVYAQHLSQTHRTGAMANSARP